MMENAMNNEQRKRDRLTIWQQNVNKSLITQHAVLAAMNDDIDILCLQEPYYDFNKKSRATQKWRPVYPRNHKENEAQKSRTVMLVSRRLATDAWTRLNVESVDVVAIRLETSERTLRIFNIYNAGEHSGSLRAVERFINSAEGRRTRGRNCADIWVGDFNRHHPMWDDPRNGHLFTRQNLNAAEDLINLLTANRMVMTLRPRVPTLEAKNTKNLTRPDNVFVTDSLQDRIIRCEVQRHDQCPRADHFPIVTTIDAKADEHEEEVGWNFRKVEWDEFEEELGRQLEGIPRTRIGTKEEMEERLGDIMDALTRTVEAKVQRRRGSPYTKRWWSEELSRMRARARKLGRESWRRIADANHPIHEDFRRARNDYGQAIKDEKRRHWEEWLEQVDTKTVWDAKKFVTAAPTDGGRTRIPALQETVEGRTTEVEENREKARLFHKAFFYDRPNDVDTHRGHQYPPPAFEWTPVTNAEIYAAVAKLKPHKAPGLSGIPNIVIMKTKYTLVPYLGPVFRATFTCGAYPERWKTFKTVVLKKPGRDNYGDPNSYRPIALLDTIAKVLSACVKNKLAYLIEKHDILPKHQFGGRPGRSTTDSLHKLTTFVKGAWRRKKEVVALFLDVKGAFPNTVPEVLAHEMRKRGVPNEVVGWFEAKLSGRKTVITFDDYTSATIPVESGLDQGCNTSGLCYNFYNAGQIEGAREREGELATSFADDTVVAAEGRNMEEAARKVEDLMEREGGPGEWAVEHFSLYETRKFVGVGFSRRKKRNRQRGGKSEPAQRPSITVAGIDIQVKPVHKFLGVLVDQELRFREHAAYAQGKGTAVLMNTKRLVKVRGGMRGEFARRIYEAVVAPTMLYAADVWCTPDVVVNGRTVEGSKGAKAKLARVQRMGALQVTGALRSTPNDLLEAHAGLLPMSVRVQKICVRAAARIASMPETHPLHKVARRAARFVKKHRAPLHYILKALGEDPREVERIDIVRKPPGWKCPVEVTIDSSVDEAVRREWSNEADIRVYTDGSGHKGRIGAAAVLYRGFEKPKVARKCLGRQEEHTVFEGECVGQALGMELLRRELTGRRIVRTAAVGTDNQAGMLALRDPGPGTGRYLIDEVLKGIQRIRSTGSNVDIGIFWTPGHQGIPGNERADKEAKKAAEGNETGTAGLRFLGKPLPKSRAAILMRHKREWRNSTEQKLSQSPRFMRTKAVDPNWPNAAKILTTLADLPRKHASLLVQLRTGHCPLNAYLHRIQKADSPICAYCGNAPETVHHYLLECRAHDDSRRSMSKVVYPGPKAMSILLSDPNVITVLFTYIHATRRFERSFGDLSFTSVEAT